MPNKLQEIMNTKICDKEINYKKLNPKNWKRPSFKKIVRFFIILVFLLAAIIIIRDEYDYRYGGYYDEYDNDDDYTESEKFSDSDCNVQGIEIHGRLVTYLSPEDMDFDGYILTDKSSSDNIIYDLIQAESNPDIKAILLEIDSLGGSPVASYEVNQILSKRIGKPVVVMVREAATSGAYIIAAAADQIFATPYSDVGGIGITMSYLDYVDQNKKEGIGYNSLSVGKYKDYGDPDKALTAEEKDLLMRDLNIIYDDIVKTVASDRGLDIDKMKELSDGSSMPGQLAKDNGLVDQLGGILEVKAWLKDRLGEDIGICW